MFLLERDPSRIWRMRLGLLLAIFIALCVFLAVTLIRYAQSVSDPSDAVKSHPIANTDVSAYGANFFLSQEVESWKIERTLQMASEAGIRWAKLHFPWEEIEPTHKGEYLDPVSKQDSWAKFDRIVAACEQENIRIIARLDRPPDWSRKDNTLQECPPDRLSDYGDFVYTFVSRYRGRIDYVQIWNEPNIYPEWGNRAVDPAGYVELLQIAYRRAKEANPNIQVLCAPLAITLGQRHPEAGKWIAMSDLQYLEEMYRAGVRGSFDIYSANAFGMDRPPEDPASPDVLNFQRVTLQREIMERYGDGDKAVWFNEFGWNAPPDTIPAENRVWRQVTEAEQAEYTIRGIELAQEEWPWAGVFMIWYFRQVGNIPTDDATYYFRMVEPDFTPRLLYFAVQDVASQPTLPGPGSYEETNPHIERYGQWDTILDLDASAQSMIQTSTPGSSMAFRFRGTGVDLVTQRGPTMGRFVASLDGQSIDGLSRTTQGETYIDLYNAHVQTRVRIPLLRDGSSGEHTLRLTLLEENSGSGEPAGIVDAFEVVVDKPRFPWVTVIASIAAIVVAAWLAWSTWRHARYAIVP